MPERIEITEDIFDSVAAPIAAAVALSGIDAQLDLLNEISSELTSCFAVWDDTMRQRAARDLRRSLVRTRETLDRIEGLLPEEKAP